MEKLVTMPIVQYGFLGFSAVLLCIIIWLIRKLLQSLEANQRIVAANTAAITSMTVMVSDLMELTRSLHDKLISRPCIAREE
ncbi:MAG: hypothetical protein JXL80_17520 [Planctomycetes bacterium]|nr:hypothetical protein [Planctomycetota bacterium]